MKKHYRQIVVNVYITVMLLTAFFGICLFFQKFFDIHPLIPAVFMLAVFLISRFTTGYLYGIVALTIITSLADSSVKVWVVLLKIAGFFVFVVVAGCLFYQFFLRWSRKRYPDRAGWFVI